jgi:hypothetical protein
MSIQLMQKRRLWKFGMPVLLAVLVSIGIGGTAFAVTSSSSHYQVTQTQFTSGTSSQSCSGSYCAKVSVGDAAVGNAASTDTSAKFGSITNSDPLLEVIVQSGQSDLGTLTTEKTGTKTMTIKIRNYLSDGYVMQIVGEPPKFNGHVLSTSNTPVQSVPGTEQFGINIAANTNPVVGANLLQVPDDKTSFGIAYPNYSSPNVFMYTPGDNVAHSTKSSGETDYTISMIVNISNATPAGHYSGDFSAVVIPVY